MLYLNTNIESISEQQLKRMIQLLPLQRQQTALKFSHSQGQRECVLSYMELWRGLKEEYGMAEPPVFAFMPKGKPYLADHPDIHFSISHCRMAVGCLIHSKPCGLDIERIRPFNKSLVEHTMNEEECRQIFSSDSPDIAFTRLWTRKEAVLKLHGIGIADNLQDALSPQSTQGIILHTTEYPQEGFILTCAIQSE